MMPRTFRDFRKFGLDANDMEALEYHASIPYSEPKAAVMPAHMARNVRATNDEHDAPREKVKWTSLGHSAVTGGLLGSTADHSMPNSSARDEYEDDPAFAAGLAQSRRDVADMLDDINRKTCYLNAQYSAIGPNQAPNNAAFTGKPPLNETVAISPSIFGFPYGHALEKKERIKEREAAQREIRKNIGKIRITASGLVGLPGSNTFSISDAGDENIRNSPRPRFDIYRFRTQRDALKFGKQVAPTAITGVPLDWTCPK